MLVSPAEPAFYKQLGTVSGLPEKFGLDFMWSLPNSIGGGLAGAQRKTISDLLASRGDRLTRETIQIKHEDVKYAWLLLEGGVKWTTNGEMWTSHGRGSWTMLQHWSMLTSLQLQGWIIVETRSMDETIICLRSLEAYSMKKSHLTLMNRRGPQGMIKGGMVTDIEWLIHTLQSCEGWGPKTAENVIAHFGGLPVTPTITYEELLEVKGVGKALADSFFRTFAGGNLMASGKGSG